VPELKIYVGNNLGGKMKLLISTLLFINLINLATANNLQVTKKLAYLSTHSNFSSWGTKAGIGGIKAFEALQGLKVKKIPRIAIIDTGIDPHHTFLSKNIFTIVNGRFAKATTKNFGRDFSNAYKSEKVSYTPFDNHGHGTHVTGIIKSVFPVAKFLPVKFYNEKASGDDNMINLLKALEFAIKSNVDIINYSGGGKVAKHELMVREKRLIDLAKRKNILIVAASGNDGKNIDIKKNRYFPASYKSSNILSVGAYDKNLEFFNRSNYGVDTVHVMAPGKSIESSHIKGTYIMSGTSQATAFVSGVAAMLLASNPNLSVETIKELIIKSSTHKNHFSGKSQGGKLNAYNALALASK